MRVMEAVLDEHGLEEEVQARLEDAGCADFWLGIDSDMDEPSDAEDPEATATATAEAALSQLGDARGAAERQQSFVQAARDAAESTAMRLALERARMQCEDMLSASCNT